MRYIGSKRNIIRHILPIMTKERKPGQYWVEPFVGGGNAISEVTGHRLGSDININTIRALVDIRDNVHLLPKNNSEFTEADYRKLRVSDDYPFKSYAGYSFSFGSKWLGGWARAADKRDYVKESYNGALRQSIKLQGVRLVNCPYDELVIPDESIIYCDPPYKGTTGYGIKFDHDKFWDWCRLKHREYHTVFVSELDAPSDFSCIWSREINTNMYKINGKYSERRIEKLFNHAD